MFPELVGMLRNRSRSVASKQAIVPDHSTQTKASQNQNQSQTTPISSVFFTGSSRLCNGILARSIFDAMVPRSILNNNKLSNFFNNTFLANENNITRTPIVSAMNKPATTYYKMDSEAVGLAIIDSIKEGNTNICKPNRKMVLYGAKLKVQVPLHVDDDNSAFSLSKSKSPPKSPAEFGIKNRNSQMFSHFCSFGSIKQLETTDEKLSLTEMELSEDYTCVITHGPNPRTTHIFDDCIVDSCSCDPVLLPHPKNKHCSGSSPISPENHTNSLSFCITCKNKLRQGEDIYMYRGEKAFCSDECRSQEMLSEGYED